MAQRPSQQSPAELTFEGSFRAAARHQCRVARPNELGVGLGSAGRAAEAGLEDVLSTSREPGDS